MRNDGREERNRRGGREGNERGRGGREGGEKMRMSLGRIVGRGQRNIGGREERKIGGKGRREREEWEEERR